MTFLGRLLLVNLVLVKPAVAAPGSVEPGGDEQPFELPWADIPTSPEGAWATVRSEVLPELQARTQKARLLVGERKAFFEGESSLISAFPRLSSGQLNEPTVLEAELLVLDDRGIARAQLRVVDLPNFARKEQTASLKTALKQTLDQEEAADGLARRFLLSLRSHLLARPELVESELAKLREPWLATIAASRDLPDTLSEVERRERLQASRLASDDLVRLQWVVEELRMGALVSSRAAPQVDEGLELLSEVHRASAAAGRLELLLPALPADTQADVRRALNESRRVQEESDSALELRAATADVEAANQEDLEDISALSKDAVEELEQSLTSVLTEQQAALDAVVQARNRLEGDADDGARRLLDVQFLRQSHRQGAASAKSPAAGGGRAAPASQRRRRGAARAGGAG